MRRYLQLSFLALFIATIFFAKHPDSPYPPGPFLKSDPLLALAGALSSRTLGYISAGAILIILTAALIGRFYCGWICPLGTAIELFDKLAKTDRNKGKDLPISRNLNYVILLATFTIAATGLNMAHFFDPLVIINRFTTFVFFPLILLLAKGALQIAGPIAGALGLIEIKYFSIRWPHYSVPHTSIMFFLAIFIMSYLWGPRFWCRRICPLGALLALISLMSLFHRKVSVECNRCGLCMSGCPMDAIGNDPSDTDAAMCIKCMDCRRFCEVGAISFSTFSTATSGSTCLAHMPSRRALIRGLIAGFGLSFFISVDPSRKLAPMDLLRPPGAVPERRFLQMCTRCGKCVQSCPTGTLQICILESGFESLWTPRLIPRLAPCDQYCNNCGLACPSGAVRTLDITERVYAKIGTAAIDTNRCVAWAKNKLCLICDEACPYNAIYFKVVDGYKRPFVDGFKCNGCGYCEFRCPVNGPAAIRVTNLDEIRLLEGSYKVEAKKRSIKLERKSAKGREY